VDARVVIDHPESTFREGAVGSTRLGSLVRRVTAHLVCISLAVAGSQLAHSAVYRIVAPDAHERQHLLAESGHAYLHYAPLGIALLGVLSVLALFTEARSAGLGAISSTPRFWSFAVVAPATFACQEILERTAHDGTVAWGAPLQATFLLGLALQLPFALAAYAVARLLLRVAEVVGRLLAQQRARSRQSPAGTWRARVALIPRPADCRPALGPRAPPVLTP
jgi:hypothetical protein